MPVHAARWPAASAVSIISWFCPDMERECCKLFGFAQRCFLQVVSSTASGVWSYETRVAACCQVPTCLYVYMQCSCHAAHVGGPGSSPFWCQICFWTGIQLCFNWLCCSIWVFARLHIDIGMVFLLETLRCKLHSRHAFPSRKENAMGCIISVGIPSKFLSRLDFGTCFIFLLWVL